MTLKWEGEKLTRKLRRAEARGIDATMAAAVVHAKGNHGPGAHGKQRFESGSKAASGSANLERSMRITRPARRSGNTTAGRWGSQGIVYARRIELGFQGKDSAGRIVDAPAYPFLRPAAESEYPKLAGRIRRGLKRAL